MRRFMTALPILCLCLRLAIPVLAEIDYSEYSFNELLESREKLNLEIQSRDETEKLMLEKGT